MLLHGDCYEQLDFVKNESIDVIYLDPPFFTQKKHSLQSRLNDETFSFEDKWESLEEYLSFIKVRLLKCKEKLQDTGSIFLHCDKMASHYLKVLLDEVFGINNFQSEIIWSYKRWSNSKKGLLNAHQVIFFYSKSSRFKFNTLYGEYSKTTNLDQIFQKRSRASNGKSTYKKDDNGAVELNHDKKGVPLSDVWEIPFLNPKAKERVGYPTQKPILLLERILKISTNPGDIVLDPFCGSGTTLITAKLLGREYIGIDISNEAIQLTKQRLENPVKTTSQLVQVDKTDDKSTTTLILEQIDAVLVERNKGIDGFLRVDGVIKPIPVRVQRQNENIDECLDSLIRASSRNNFIFKVLITKNQNLSTSFEKKKDVIIVNNIPAFKEQKSELFKINLLF